MGGVAPEVEDRSYANHVRDEVHALYALGHYQEAERLAERARDDLAEGDEAFLMVLALVDVQRGDMAAASIRMDDLAAIRQPSLYLAVVRAAVGDLDGAFRDLLSVEPWSVGAVTLVRYWFPDVLRPLRSDPRYEALVREIETDWKLSPDGHMGDVVASR